MRSLNHQLGQRLRALDRRGESRHAAKIAQQGTTFGQGLEGIYSHSTMTNYKQVGQSFIVWARAEHDIKSDAPLDSLRPLAQEYVNARHSAGYSGATVKRDVAALNKIFRLTSVPTGKIETPAGVTTARDTITRGRTQTDYAARFNKSAHDYVVVARGFGLRRCELQRVQLSWVREAPGGYLVLDIPKGIAKGGKPRTAVCDPQMAAAVRQVLAGCPAKGNIFGRISNHYNVHGDRAAWARSVLLQATDSTAVCNGLLAAGGYTAQKSQKEMLYMCKDGSGRSYVRNALHVVSKCLGHNRLEIVVKNYL